MPQKRRHWACVCAAVFLGLAACTPRPQMDIQPQARGIGTAQAVFVATGRTPRAEIPGFTGERDTVLHFARFDVSIPPAHQLGEIALPKNGQKTDPQKHFVTLSSTGFDDQTAFNGALRQALAKTPGTSREAVVFVHGFNTNFTEGLFRAAQLSNDLALGAVVVHYSWPSLGKPLAYVYDRDSALIARDGLHALLRGLSEAGADRILIVGHSMGGSLVMEGLRQMSLTGDQRTLSRLSGVVMVSPDIDVELFKSQARQIGTLPQPFVIFTSERDRALALSSGLTARRPRLGTLADVSEVADLDVTILEVGAFSAGLGHFTAGDSPALIALLTRIDNLDIALRNDALRRTDLISGTILTIRDATRIVLSPVAAVADELRP